MKVPRNLIVIQYVLYIVRQLNETACEKKQQINRLLLHYNVI